MIKGLIHQEDIAVLNMYAPNNRSAKYVNQKLTEPKEETDNPTITVGEFNIPFSTEKITRQKICRIWKNSIIPSTNRVLSTVMETLHSTMAENSLFFFLATLHGLWDFSSQTRDRTQAPGSESTES